jgi:adenylate cyclase
MNTVTAVVQRLLKGKLSPREVSLVIVLVVFLATLTVRHLGWLQFLEFRAYDFFIRHQTRVATSDPIVLVEMTEADIQSPSLDYPLYDDKLAELLRILEADGPTTIGLDIWRDIPVPKNGSLLPELNKVLLSYSNLVVIFTLDGIVRPPPVLKADPDRVAFNDNFPPDLGVDWTIPKVRRTYLFAKFAPSGEIYFSLPFRLAMIYLERKGIVPQQDPRDPNLLTLGKARLRAFQPNDGPYVGAGADGTQILLDFKCPDKFTRFTVTQALSHQIPAGSLRDKIVLVGMNSPSVSDEKVTPTHRDHRGIEVQACTVNQLLREALNGDKPLRFWGDWLEDAWILFWCVAGGALGYRVHSPWRFGPVGLLSMSALTTIAWLAFRFGWWIPLAAPAAAFVPASGLVTSYVSYQERKARGQLMQLFAKQVSPDIAQALWDQREEFLAGQRPRSQKLTATVLFTDLVGFTATSEKLEPGFLMDWLNEYMEEMATAIMAHQGVVEKYIGDAVMAVFGAPLPRTKPEEISHDARNAVRCALVMRKKIVELNGRWQQRGLPLCSMRVGIHTGPLVAGSLGSADRQEYTVIGDSVNTASRLESFDKDAVKGEKGSPSSLCRILISEATYALLNGEFRTQEVGKIFLKNKSEPVIIYNVLD